MEEEEEEYGEMGTPFWVQSTTNLRRVDRFRRGLSSLIFSSGVLLFILLVTALFFMVFVIPTTHMFRIRSNSVMKNWDSVNLVLVLVALFFGFLAKNNTNATSNSEDNYQNTATSNVVVDQKNNTDYSDRRDDYFSSRNSNYIYPPPGPGNSRFLRRNSTSYPDLHLREQTYDNDQRRFYDDSNLDSYRIVQPYRRRSWEQSDTTPYVDDAVVSKPEDNEKLEETESSSYSPPPPPPPPPRRRTTEHKAKRVYPPDVRLVDSEVTHKSLIPPPPPLPPKAKRIYESLPRESLIQHSAEKSGRSEYKKRNGGNEGKDHNFLTSYYQKKKEKKRQRQRSVDNLDALFHQSQPQSSSVFHNLFSSRKSKKRRIPSDPYLASPPPPPPPPPQLKAARVSNPKTHVQTSLPIKIKSFSSLDDNSSSSGSSPLHSIPPPPPPFKMPEWKHVVKGDYVSIYSPDSDNAENWSPEVDTTSSPASLFCPSPDVDTKADNFIARFRAGLKLEKIDSFNKKQVSRMSNLGPGSQN